MRILSFSMTTRAFVDRSKTVTRRMGWKTLKPGTVLKAAEKCMGLKKGETITILGEIRVISIRQERLDRMTRDMEYGRLECLREGFSGVEPDEFVAFFCRGHKGCKPSSMVTRIEFEYL